MSLITHSDGSFLDAGTNQGHTQRKRPATTIACSEKPHVLPAVIVKEDVASIRLLSV